MSAEFIKIVSEMHEERFNVHLAKMIQNQTPCGIFFGFDFNPNTIVSNVQMLIRNRLNVTCAVVISVVQKESLESLVEVPIVTLEELPQKFKLQTMFIFGNLKEFTIAPYFARHGIEVLGMSDEGRFLFAIRHLPELYHPRRKTPSFSYGDIRRIDF